MLPSSPERSAAAVPPPPPPAAAAAAAPPAVAGKDRKPRLPNETLCIIQGLKSAAGQRLNGQHATIKGYSESRYNVKVENYTKLQAIKPENLITIDKFVKNRCEVESNSVSLILKVNNAETDVDEIKNVLKFICKNILNINNINNSIFRRSYPQDSSNSFDIFNKDLIQKVESFFSEFKHKATFNMSDVIKSQAGNVEFPTFKLFNWDKKLKVKIPLDQAVYQMQIGIGKEDAYAPGNGIGDVQGGISVQPKFTPDILNGFFYDNGVRHNLDARCREGYLVIEQKDSKIFFKVYDANDKMITESTIQYEKGLSIQVSLDPVYHKTGQICIQFTEKMTSPDQQNNTQLWDQLRAESSKIKEQRRIKEEIKTKQLLEIKKEKLNRNWKSNISNNYLNYTRIKVYQAFLFR